MVGIPGSGKSLFAEKFAATFHAPYVKYDTIMTVAGQNSATSDMYAGYMLRELFKTGHTVIFDGPATTRAERAALKDLATSAGYTSLFIWVQTDEATAKSRFLKSGKEARRRVSEKEFDTLLGSFVAPIQKEHPTVVISGKHTYATQVKAVLKNLTLTKQIARSRERLHEQPQPASTKRNIILR
jgi:predicted kinase